MTQSAATILIIDDDVHVRELLEVLLQNQGYRTLTAESGELALAMIKRQAPDLILLDIMMPGMDGYEVASQLKAEKNQPHRRRTRRTPTTGRSGRSTTG
ncbi:PAS:GGDEF protein [Pseudomonas syringae pv. japonica str. M301072]|uniref:PAS:GGDEF protein n=1 Tax=Pseudomonas syringae pv. japonica str. M301072 TaxID=629262 RepID=F3FCU6_PSESX|nr:PAS:GGDEF protein [Pseudomonas syringae pv. japonica str. M301072]